MTYICDLLLIYYLLKNNLKLWEQTKEAMNQ